MSEARTSPSQAHTGDAQTGDARTGSARTGDMLAGQGQGGQGQVGQDQAGPGQAMSTSALLQRAVALHKANQLEQARQLYLKVIEQEPNHARAIQYLGVVARRQGKPRRAIELMQRSLELNDQDVGCYNNLSRAYIDAGRPGKAAEAARQGLALAPNSAPMLNQLANALTQRKDFQEAIDAREKSIELDPDNAETRLSQGATLQMMGRLDDAQRVYEEVVDRFPDMARAHQNLGALLKSKGDMEAAREAYLRAIDLQPDMTGAWRALVDMKKYTSADDRDVEAVLQVYQRSNLDRDQRANVCFALGKIYDDLRDYDKAFGFYAEGNAVYREKLKPNIDRSVAELRQFRRSVDAGLLTRWRGAGDPDPTPIFILGMPRSGTTLTEQILASHPKVEGAGELYDLARTISNVKTIAGVESDFPHWLEEIDETGLKALGRAYLDAIREGRGELPFITDKMPANFRFVGLIRMMLPNAKIVHTRRHPGDTCLSCFTKLFTEGQEFTFNLGDLGRYYRAYDELMAHWRAVLPPGDMLEVAYERLVSDMETQTRRLLDFCGLEWHDDCLRFHENKRSVATASLMQVRRPVYTSSVQRWRRYEDHLNPLFQAMGQGFKESGPE